MHTTPTKTLIQLTAVKVLRNTEIAPSVYVLSFDRTFDFVAGQVLGLALAPDDDPRLYSIASGEQDPEVSILYNIKPGGKLTPNLAELKSGDKLWITPPFGSYHGSGEPAWWIAAGTGIAPFRSMLRSGLGTGKVMVHGGKFMDSFYFEDEWKQSLEDKYFRCSSQQPGPGVFHGRVTRFLEQQAALPQDQKYYLCGSAEMVVECREILLSKGIPFNNIVAEIYF